MVFKIMVHKCLSAAFTEETSLSTSTAQIFDIVVTNKDHIENFVYWMHWNSIKEFNIENLKRNIHIFLFLNSSFSYFVLQWSVKMVMHSDLHIIEWKLPIQLYPDLPCSNVVTYLLEQKFHQHFGKYIGQ